MNAAAPCLGSRSRWKAASALSLCLAWACAPGWSTPPAPESPPTARAAHHWAFQPLAPRTLPSTKEIGRIQNPIDRLLRAGWDRAKLAPGPEADRATLIRRVALLLTGLPPTPEEVSAYLHDRAPDATDQMIERYLGSSRYGERWAKYWLDAAGYTDSNGYFSADSDRPLAYRYRDYVVRSLNRDKPWDQFVREQLAGDELSEWKPGQPATPEIIELLEATHFLRNGQDGSGESDGNPDEVRVDHLYALDSALQIVGSSLLGLTFQCAKCHDHKFEPITQKDYYALQAVLYPAFNLEKWVKPNDRIVQANLPGELEKWETREKDLTAEETTLKDEFTRWASAHRPRGAILLEDSFPPNKPLAERWSNTAPGDDASAGNPAVQVDSETAPGAIVKDGALQIIEGGGSGDRWLSTRQAFSWRPARTGEWIQATFDLVATQLNKQGPSAERVAYLIALHDFNDNSGVAGGNILIDGNPGGATSVHVDYPGADSVSRGVIGVTGYRAGRNYGIRITALDGGQYRLEHLVDGAVDGASVKLKGDELPDGGFGFEYCCGRSFVVDNVVIEATKSGDPAWADAQHAFELQLKERQKTLEIRTKALTARRTPKPGAVAWVSDMSPERPEVHLLKRGNPKTPGEVVEPATPVFLSRPGNSLCDARPAPHTTGRRLAWARWLTEPASPQAALLARVTVNRVWQHYFGVGLVATPDNLGLSGSPPTQPEVLERLAAEFIETGWSLKSVHRVILRSAAFRQSSAARARGMAKDPGNRLLWRFPVQRLDAEAIRDAMLAVSGRLGAKTNGPYVPTLRNSAGEVVIEEGRPESYARSLFLQQRRTQIANLLGVFDAPSIVFSCSRRADTTMPLQSLSLLNSEFAVTRAQDLAQRLQREAGDNRQGRLQRAYLLISGHPPDAATARSAERFLAAQAAIYGGTQEAWGKAWADFCQMLLASNEFLYLE